MDFLNSSSDEDYELAANKVSRKRIAKCFESDDSDSDNNVLVTPAKFKKPSQIDNYEATPSCSKYLSSDNEESGVQFKRRRKSKRTPITSEKEKRQIELQKLAAARQESKNKVRRRIDFQEEAEEESDISEEVVHSSQETDNAKDESDSEEKEENISDEGEEESDSSSSNSHEHDQECDSKPESSREEEEEEVDEKEDQFDIIRQRLQNNYEQNQSKRNNPNDDSGNDSADEEKEDVSEEGKVIYARLMENLREFAVNGKDLTHMELIEQFEPDGSDYDPTRSESCVCGKEGLVHLFFIKNKLWREINIIEYATKTIIIGSECINHWYKKKNLVRGYKNVKPIESEFMKWLKNGIVGHIRQSEILNIGRCPPEANVNTNSKREMVLTIALTSKVIFKDFNVAREVYDLKIKKIKNNAITVKVIVPPNMKRVAKTLKKDSRHRFYLRFKAEDYSRDPPGLNFYLQDVQSAESKVYKTSEPTTGKDFLK